MTDQIPDKRQPKKGKVSFGSWLEGMQFATQQKGSDSRRLLTFGADQETHTHTEGVEREEERKREG